MVGEDLRQAPAFTPLSIPIDGGSGSGYLNSIFSSIVAQGVGSRQETGIKKARLAFLAKLVSNIRLVSISESFFICNGGIHIHFIVVDLLCSSVPMD